MKTTLNQIREHGPCTDGWAKLLKNLGKTKADDEPINITTIFESNGLDDALWCLRAVKNHEREMRLFAVECARSVQHLMTDKRSLNALDVSERFANGLATEEELSVARAAAGAAARAAAGAATKAATKAATRAATWAAKWAAGAAAVSAERDASGATWAASGATWAASGAASRASRGAQANLLILVCEGAFND